MRRLRPITALGMFVCTVAIFPHALAQASITQILNNGPTDKRINIVFFSEGYTSSQLSQYLVDAESGANALLDILPLSQYRSYFNAFAISVPSNDSGSDHPSRNIYRDTYFNSTYDGLGVARLILIDGVGSRRVDSLLQRLMPEYDIIIMLVNDPEYGGSGGWLAIASMHSLAPELVRHEVGHSFARLGDEYSDPYPYPDWEEPNTTKETRREFIKWRSWILESTPIPTPPDNIYETVVGLFEGAHYHATGWYRPKFNCMMRSLFAPFCEVCSEEFVKSIYSLVRPIESHSPLPPAVSMADTDGVVLSVQPMVPVSHNLDVRWFVDGAQNTGAASPFFPVVGTQLGIGQHTVHAIVRDTTALVRNDPTNLLGDSTSWTVLISATSPPSIASLSPDRVVAGGGGFLLSVNGSGFVDGSIVRWDDSNRTTTYVNNGGLIASIHPADIAGGGIPQITVQNMFPGVGTSAPVPFYVFPSRPLLSAPSNGSINEPITTTVRWNRSIGAAHYHLQVSVDSSFGAFTFGDSTLTDTTRTLTLPSYDRKYYWRVRGRNSAGEGEWSESWSFTTSIRGPERVILESPVNGGKLATDTVRCIWHEGQPAVTRYWFEWSEESSFSASVIDSTIADTSALVTGLSGNTTRYWRVRGRNIAGWGPFSDVWHFRVAIVGVAGTDHLPTVFRLGQNFPNPFNPLTKIEYDVPSAIRVTVRIYSILGEEVVTLVDEVKPPGRYTVEWTAGSNASGIYMYRFQAGEFVQTKKLVVLR